MPILFDYACDDCGNRFESMDDPEEVVCPVCVAAAEQLAKLYDVGDDGSIATVTNREAGASSPTTATTASTAATTATTTAATTATKPRKPRKLPCAARVSRKSRGVDLVKETIARECGFTNLSDDNRDGASVAPVFNAPKLPDDVQRNMHTFFGGGPASACGVSFGADTPTMKSDVDVLSLGRKAAQATIQASRAHAIKTDKRDVLTDRA